jgi:adenylate cyclase
MQNSGRIKWFKGLLIGFFSFILLALVSQSRIIELLELKSLDFKFFLRGLRPADPRVFLIGIDDPSIKFLGRWPWPRSYHAALLETLSKKTPSTLGFDILFNEPDESHLESDQALIEMSGLFDGLTFAAYFRQEHSSLASWSKEVLKQNELKIEVLDLFLRKARGLRIPLQGLSKNGAWGFINAPPDFDGSVRRVPMIFRFRDHVLPSFSLRMIMDYYALSGKDVEIIHGPYGLKLRLKLKEGSLDVPINRRGDYLVNFRSGLKEVPSGSFARMLQQENDLQGKLAIVGLTGTGITDAHPTPLSPHTPLVMVHVNVLQNILQNDFLKVLPRFFELILLFMVCFLTGIVSYAARKNWAALGSIGILIFYVGLNFILFKKVNLHFALVSPLLGILFSYLVSTTLRYWLEEKEKRYVKKAFQHYVSPGVLESVLKDPKRLELGGKREDLTVLFSDVRMFSTFCERKDPEEVVSILNEYFDAMTEIVLGQGGTLDKYLGDGLMAIFGAPMALDEDHAIRAVRAAFLMQEKLKLLREKWLREGKEALFIGVGINSGPMVVGNMGSSHVMNYTVVGDEVNLAARIEGLTRQFNVDVIISQSTYERVCSQWETRFLGEVKVKGKEKAVGVYEILKPKGS